MKIIKYNKKNPNLNNEEYIDDMFIDILCDGLLLNDPMFLSSALVYKNIGDLNLCEDCENIYYDCICEGNRDYDVNKPKSRSNNPACPHCDVYYCLCDYGITKDYDQEQDILLGKIIFEIAKKYLSKEQLIKLQTILKCHLDKKSQEIINTPARYYLIELNKIINNLS